MEKEKKSNTLEVKSNVRGIFENSFHEFSPLSFLPILGRTFWEIQGKNTYALPFIFLPPYPTKHTPKKFFFPFFLQSFSSILFHLQTNTPLLLQEFRNFFMVSPRNLNYTKSNKEIT